MQGHGKECAVTELDLGLKCGVRRLLWSMGYSTRLDVELRGSRPTTSGRPAPAETFTDLDVLGVAVSNESRLSTVIADCKTGRRDRATARVFWLRGVSDLFAADQAMLVRDNAVKDGVRQLAARLGITVLAPEDLLGMQELYLDPQAGDLDVLFDRKYVADHLAAFTGLDRRLGDLLEFLQFDYWVYDQHRNLTQVVAHLSEARKLLDPTNPVHIAVVLDLSWEYVLTLAKAIEHVRGVYLTNPERGLQEYMFGGAIELQEKQATADALQALAPEGAQESGYLPNYYPKLRELFIRFLRRPNEVQDALRYIELACALCVGRRRVTIGDALGGEFDPVAAKLAADVVGFLTASADLDPRFRSQARAYLLAEPINAGPPASISPNSAAASGSQPPLELAPQGEFSEGVANGGAGAADMTR